MQAPTFAHGAPRRRRHLKKLIGLTAGWMMIAGVAFAAWTGSATGTLTASSTNPTTGATVTFMPSQVMTFSNAGSTSDFTIRVTLPASATGVYTSLTTQATSSIVQGGCPAGSITIAAGQTVAFSNPPFGPGPDVGDTTSTIRAAMGASAPDACRDLASIQVPITVTLS